jgi:hypothetical protein
MHFTLKMEECRPKHIDENIMNKIHHKFCGVFVGYLYILDMIIAWKLEHIKIIPSSSGDIMPCSSQTAVK